jgi:PAS domain S-box-containing protein
MSAETGVNTEKTAGAKRATSEAEAMERPVERGSAGERNGAMTRSREELVGLLVEQVRDYAIFLLDPEGKVESWNEGAKRIKGYEEQEIVGKHFSIFYPPEVAASGWPEHELKVAREEGRFEDENWRVRKDGSRFWANVVITCLKNEAGEIQGFAKVTRDLTERKRLEEELRQREERYRELVNGVKDYAIILLDPDGQVLTWNEGAERLKGYSKSEIVGRHFSIFYPREAVESEWPKHELTIAAKEGKFIDEGWRVRKDGSRFWASVAIAALRDQQGKLYGFSKVTRDMSERRDWEEQIQELNAQLRRRLSELTETQKLVELRTLELQNLSGRLLTLQDDERRRLARELHDELGQDLSALKMLLETRGPQTEELGEAIQLADQAVRSVRSMSYLLHPPLLDEVGLLPAVHWLVEGLQNRSGIRIQVEVRPSSFPRLPRDIETTIFRVIQEALTNVYRHSGSGQAKLEIERRADRVLLRLRDYGKGFGAKEKTDASLAKGGVRVGVGIGGMRERLKQLGGDLHITSAEPGTLVEAVIPLFHGADAAATS